MSKWATLKKHNTVFTCVGRILFSEEEELSFLFFQLSLHNGEQNQISHCSDNCLTETKMDKTM